MDDKTSHCMLLIFASKSLSTAQGRDPIISSSFKRFKLPDFDTNQKYILK